jgi:hypothetical protein
MSRSVAFRREKANEGFGEGYGVLPQGSLSEAIWRRRHVRKKLLSGTGHW